MSLILLFALCLIGHFIADFLFQPRWMATGKSEKLAILIKHCQVQYIVLSVILGIAFSFSAGPSGVLKSLLIALINAGLHGVVDWNIWRGYKKFVGWRMKTGRLETVEPAKYPYWQDHWFYTTIGFDQLLHGLSLLFALWIVLR